MARVLILSSMVACGHVGASAALPALQALGHTATVLPTVMLSNHPGFAAVAGAKVPVGQLEDMVAALDRNGFLEGHDAVLTGYLPTAEHVDFAALLVDRMRGIGVARVVVDPVMGDAPKGLYIDAEAAGRMRDMLVPRADILTPNAFEQVWLGEVASSVPRVIVTSHGVTARELGVLDLSQAAAVRYAVPRHDGVPQGTGDVLAALIAAGVAPGQALGHLQTLIAESLGAPHLRITETAPVWTRAAPLEGEPHGL